DNFDVAGYKWNDTNGNGVWDGGELGKSGWTIYLDNDTNFGNGVTASTTTNANLHYQFTNLCPVTYYVYEKTDSGWTNTYNGTTNFVCSNGTAPTATSALSLHDALPIFDNFDVAGYKWNDTNGNGVWDGGELGKSGWTIYLDNDTNFGNGVT